MIESVLKRKDFAERDGTSRLTCLVLADLRARDIESLSADRVEGPPSVGAGHGGMSVVVGGRGAGGHVRRNGCGVDATVDLLAMDRHLRRGLDAEADLVVLDPDDGHHDAVSNVDPFANLPG
jgi:hypothetical protein